MADHIIVARYQKGGQKFELVIDPEKAVLYRQGKASLGDAVRFPQVYTDAKKGEKAAESALKRSFDTDEFEKVADEILRKGDIPQSKNQREAEGAQIRARLIEMIHRSGVDPKTHAPHPNTRIDAAMNEAKVRIDINISADAQFQDVIKQLRPILPFKQEIHTLRVMVPVNCVGAALKIIKGTGRLLKEDWSGNGDLIATVEVPGGLSVDFQESLMAATHGKAAFTVLKQE
jgi:ribosome maturation protein SDO1